MGNRRGEIMNNYYDYLQNECLSDLSENDQLILQHDNEYQELCESFEAIKIYCDESSAKEELRNNITCGICFDCHSSFESTFLEGFIFFNLLILEKYIFIIQTKI